MLQPQTANQLREMIAELKAELNDPNLPFGVDLLIPQVGGTARKTNVDYTKGKLDELINVIIEGGARLFVSAVGVPPKYVVDRLHEAGIPYMNMVGMAALYPLSPTQWRSRPADLLCKVIPSTSTKPAPSAATSSAPKAAKPAVTLATSPRQSSHPPAPISASNTSLR